MRTLRSQLRQGQEAIETVKQRNNVISEGLLNKDINFPKK